MKIIKTNNFTKTSQSAEELEVHKNMLEQQLEQVNTSISDAKTIEEDEDVIKTKKTKLVTDLDSAGNTLEWM